MIVKFILLFALVTPGGIDNQAAYPYETEAACVAARAEAMKGAPSLPIGTQFVIECLPVQTGGPTI